MRDPREEIEFGICQPQKSALAGIGDFRRWIKSVDAVDDGYATLLRG